MKWPSLYFWCINVEQTSPVRFKVLPCKLIHCCSIQIKNQKHFVENIKTSVFHEQSKCQKSLKNVKFWEKDRTLLAVPPPPIRSVACSELNLNLMSLIKQNKKLNIYSDVSWFWGCEWAQHRMCYSRILN